MSQAVWGEVIKHNLSCKIAIVGSDDSSPLLGVSVSYDADLMEQPENIRPPQTNWFTGYAAAVNRYPGDSRKAVYPRIMTAAAPRSSAWRRSFHSSFCSGRVLQSRVAVRRPAHRSGTKLEK